MTRRERRAMERAQAEQAQSGSAYSNPARPNPAQPSDATQVDMSAVEDTQHFTPAFSAQHAYAAAAATQGSPTVPGGPAVPSTFPDTQSTIADASLPATSYHAPATARPFVKPASGSQAAYTPSPFPENLATVPPDAYNGTYNGTYTDTYTGDNLSHASNPSHANGRRTPEYQPLGPVRATIRGFGELCITAGLVLILFVVWQLWWTDIEANQDNENLASSLITQWKDNPRNELPEDPDTPVVAQVPPENQAFGIMYVPRFGDDYYRTIAEGVQLEPVLNRMGMGHYPSTARPGEVGNFAMAGHRVTYGKPLNLIAELRPGDPIVIQTAEGFYTYTFRNFEIVLPNATEVLAPVPAHPDYKGKERIMTLTACNPMFSAQERYIAYAELTDWRPAAEGPPDTIKDSPAFQKAGGTDV